MIWRINICQISKSENETTYSTGEQNEISHLKDRRSG